MLRNILGVAGLIVLLLAAGLAGVLWLMRADAQTRDTLDQKHGVIVGDFPPCSWDVDMPARVVSEGSSQSLIVRAANPNAEECQSALTLLAPGFDHSPRNAQQTLIAKPKSEGSIAWVMVAQKTGNYEFIVTDGVKTRALGVSVTNVFGLTALQAQLLSVLGSLFGPMFTVPWWFDRWQKRKQAKQPQAAAKPELAKEAKNATETVEPDPK